VRTALAVIAIAAGAMAQGVAGIGFSLIAVPLLVLSKGPVDAVRIGNTLAIVVNALGMARERAGVDLRRAGQLLVPALIVTPVAAWCVHRIDAPALSVIAGVLIVGSALALASGARAHRLRGAYGAAIAGATSATMNAAAGVGGPAVAMYGLNADWPTPMLRPTLQAYFAALNVATVIALGPAHVSAGFALVALIALGGGFWAGAVLTRNLDQGAARRAILIIASAGGIAAIVRGLVG
jgi:uncharacterized membrane protein YfcA